MIIVRFTGVARPSDETRIAHNVEAYMTSDDPATCGYATERYLEQATGLPGEAASAACFYPVGPQSETGPRSIEVSEIGVDGDVATAQVGAAIGDLLTAYRQ